MERLHNGFMLDTPPGTFPLSTDSMLLADFIQLPRSAKVLDLGAGCATLGHLLCAKDANCHVTGIELDTIAHEAALKNIEANSLQARISSICGDIRSLSHTLPAGSFTTCVSNPPYFTGGPASKDTPLARRNDYFDIPDIMECAGRVLQYGGDLYLVHKPENLAHLCACAAKNGLEAKRLCVVRHCPENPISMILLQFRKGGKPGLKWEELNLFHRDGTPTAAYCRIYHL